MFAQVVRKVWQRLAMLGLIVTESAEPRVADAERKWGVPNEGLALSLAAVDADETGLAPDLSIALKNLGDVDRTLNVPEWMAFYQVLIDAPVSDYGELLRRSAVGKPRQQVTIRSGKFVEMDIPIDRIYILEKSRLYRIAVECPLGLRSNTVEVIL